MSLITFFTSLFNIGLGIGETIAIAGYKVLLFIDALVYTLVAYTFKVFLLIANINFNSLNAIMEPVVSRAKALIIVFIVYRIGIALITYLADPEKITKEGEGKDILKNILITAVLLLSYNFIFNVLNEVSILVLGNQIGYKYVTLEQFFDLNKDENSGDKDPGLLMKVIFGSSADQESLGDPGTYLAFGIAKLWITEEESRKSVEGYIQNTICTGGDDGKVESCDFYKLPDLAEDIQGKKLHYTWALGALVGGFIIYTMAKACLEVATRMFELILLQLLAPIACLCVLGKGGLKNDNFKSYLNQYKKSYLSAFIRVATVLIITVFITQFLKSVNTYIPNLAKEDFLTNALVIIILCFAGYTFVSKVPGFIDNALFGGKNNWKDTKNVVGGLLSGAVGAVTGLAGGIAAGGRFGGALVGAAKGAKSGYETGSKGDKVWDMFKSAKSGASAGKVAGADVRSRGGLGEILTGKLETVTGKGARLDREIQDLDEEQAALDEVAAAEKYAVKDTKMGDWGSDPEQAAANKEDFENYVDTLKYSDERKAEIKNADSKFISSIKDEKLGEDKDAYASRNYDKSIDFINAKAKYDYMNSGQDIKDAEAQLSTAQLDLENATNDRTAAEAELTTVNSELATANSDFEAAKTYFGVDTNLEDVQTLLSNTDADIASIEEELNEAISTGKSTAEINAIYSRRANAMTTKVRCESYIEASEKVTDLEDKKAELDTKVSDAITRQTDAQQRVVDGNAKVAEVHTDREDKLNNLASDVERTKNEAIQLLKDYHDVRKGREAKNDADAQAKTSKFINLRNKHGHGASRTDPSFAGVKEEGKRVHARKAETVNDPAYSRTRSNKK